MRASTENLASGKSIPFATDPAAGTTQRGIRDTGRFLTSRAGPETQRRLTLQEEPTSSWNVLELWSHLVSGELLLSSHLTADDRMYLVAEGRASAEAERARLTIREVAVLCRLLAGDSQKATAYELGLCPSTVATHAARAFGKLNLSPSPCGVPLALVLIGQAACAAIQLPDARVTASLRQGQRYVVANVPRPPLTRLARLTSAEREVALALVDGLTKFDIAQARCTSVHTIGRQISSLFAKLNVKGRFDLVCRMMQ